MHARTKIICTIGPAVSGEEKIIQLIDAGLNVARINMSHGTHQEHEKTIALLKKVRREKGVPLGIMLDTKGPEVRVCQIKGGQISLEEGQVLRILNREVEGTAEAISVTPVKVIEKIPLEATILFNDGYIEGKVIKKDREGISVKIGNRGVLRSSNGVNIPYVDLDLPAVTKQDIKDIVFGCGQGMDILAASFIRSAEHILTIKKLLAEEKASHVQVVAKIESALGVKHFDSILQVSDGIMVARGDLGVELPVTQVPKLQKEMIRKCYQAFKPVATATQMLESMITSPRPTRAEVSDVFNATYDSTSAVMLSGETAIGKFPIRAVEFMRSTILEAEKEFNYTGFFHHNTSGRTFYDTSSSVALAAIKTAYSGNGRALIALTTGGFTARVMARFRPEMPIIAITPDEKTYHQLSFVWGVIPVHAQVFDVKEGIEVASSFLLRRQLIDFGELIVVTSGAPFGVSGSTNMMLVETIGQILIRGYPGQGKRVHGKVKYLEGIEKEKIKGRLVVLSECDAQLELKGAAGIILQTHLSDLDSQKQVRRIAQACQCPFLISEEAVCSVLKEDQLITLDPEKGLVFSGAIEEEEKRLFEVFEKAKKKH